MPAKFCFYVHHHGSGHITRALAIAESLKPAEVVLMGSALNLYVTEIPRWINTITLPMDISDDEGDAMVEQTPSFLHYAPFHMQGLKDRNAIMTAYFARNPDMLLIVDVSVEVALLARLCGVPVIVVRQHGERDDLPHQLAYESAALLLAPYSRSMHDKNTDIYTNKTFFSGGFSRYSSKSLPVIATDPHAIAVFIGRGGTKLNQDFLSFLRTCLPFNYHIHVLGTVKINENLINTTLHGELADPVYILSRCAVVIGNAGHNMVMEMADLQKHFICIPAERPFDEQKIKSQHLQRIGVTIVAENDIYSVNWEAVILEAKKFNLGTWEQVTQNGALKQIAERLHCLYHTLFFDQ